MVSCLAIALGKPTATPPSAKASIINANKQGTGRKSLRGKAEL